MLEPTPRAINLNTAGGIVAADKMLRVSFGVGLENFSAEPVVLPSTPSVLSVGKRCLHQGFSSFWVSGKHPCFITPRGVICPLDVEGDVPLVKPQGLWRSCVGDRHKVRELCGVYFDGKGRLQVDSRFKRAAAAAAAETATEALQAEGGADKDINETIDELFGPDSLMMKPSLMMQVMDRVVIRQGGI